MVEERSQLLKGLSHFPPERFSDADFVGEGSNATVFRAWDEHLQRSVAFKVSVHDLLVEELDAEHLDELGITEGIRQLVDEAKALQHYTLVREGRLLARVDHPNVIPVLDIGLLEDGALAVVMPFLEAGDLSEQDFHRPWEEVLDIALQIGRGLAAIHAAGMLHRDFKPNNILFDREGRPRIADLGLGCLVDDAEAMSQWVGTIDYMAPEVFEQRFRDVRDDLYAYCMIVYEMYYGHGPFASQAARMQGRVTAGEREGGMPKALHELLVRGLAPDPEQRWPNMKALLRAMEQVRQPAPPRRWPRIAGGLAATFLVGMFLATQTVKADECDEIAGEIESFWNEEAALELRGVLGTRKGSDALTSWASRWVAVRGQECQVAKKAGDPLTPSPCMTRSLLQFTNTVETLRTPHLREGLRFAQVIAALPAPEHCLEHPESAGHPSGGLLRLRELDGQIHTLVQIGNLELARTLQAEYMKEAQALRATYDIGRARFRRGELRFATGELDGAKLDFDHALEQAEALGADEFAAEVLTQLAALADARGDAGAVAAYAQSARARFSTTNPPRVAEVLIVEGLGLMNGDDDDRARGIELLRDAVAMREEQYRDYGGSREPIGWAAEALARGWIEVGRYDRAVEAARRSLEIHTEAFHGSTPRARDLRRVLFTGLMAGGRKWEAEAVMLDVLDPLQLDEEYATYFAELGWFITRAKKLGAIGFAAEWRMIARRDALQYGYPAPVLSEDEGL